MLKISEIIDKDTKGDVGIELEAEFGAARYPEPQTRDWTVKPEGSLRGVCAEYVSSSPFYIDKEFEGKLEALSNLVNAPAARVVHDSPRTSVHVHTNVLGLTPVELMTFGTAYWVIENALFNYCGEERKDNLFCLRLCDAEGTASLLRSCADSDRFFSNITTDNLRYSGLNWKAVGQFGSAEFRGMRGTTDKNIIKTWATELHMLKVKSTSIFKNPAEVLDAYANCEKKDFVAKLLSSEFAKTIFSYRNWSEGMDSNVYTLSQLAYSQDWNKWGNRFKAKPKVSKEEEIMERAQRIVRNREPEMEVVQPRGARRPNMWVIDDEPMPAINPNARWAIADNINAGQVNAIN